MRAPGTEDPAFDRLVAAFLALAQEHWTLAERVAALEGKPAAEPDASAAARAFVGRILDPLREPKNS